MKKIVLYVSFVFSFVSALSLLEPVLALSISGKVQYKNQPIEGAQVSIMDTSISTDTDADGNFTLSGLSENSLVTLKISRQGYRDYYQLLRMGV